MIDTRVIVETVEAASIMGERLLRHARALAHDRHPDQLSHRDLVATSAAIVALLNQVLEAIEREGDELE